MACWETYISKCVWPCRAAPGSQHSQHCVRFSVSVVVALSLWSSVVTDVYHSSPEERSFFVLASMCTALQGDCHLLCLVHMPRPWTHCHDQSCSNCDLHAHPSDRNLGTNSFLKRQETFLLSECLFLFCYGLSIVLSLGVTAVVTEFSAFTKLTS